MFDLTSATHVDRWLSPKATNTDADEDSSTPQTTKKLVDELTSKRVDELVDGV